MVITPKDLENKILNNKKLEADKENKLIIELEKKIDDYLTNEAANYDHSISYPFFYELPDKAPFKVVKALCQKYENAGWHMIYEHDYECSGYDYLVFMLKK